MKKSDIIEILKHARQLLKRGWCQEALAQDKDCFPCPSWSENACQWCASGAIRRASWVYDGCMGLQGDSNSEYWARSTFSRISGILCIPIWNDDANRTQKQILKTFDRVIRQLKTDDGV